MNTSALKSFAPAVRHDLIEAVGRKLAVVLAAQTPDYRTTFAPQVAALRELARVDRTALIEKVAYTWFNRLTALRYLDARGWHPFGGRVLTSAGAESTQPELLKLAREGALPDGLKRYTDAARIDSLLDGKLPSSNAQGEVYRDLVLASCRFYHALLPDVFERLDDATELLLPDDLVTEQSVVQGFRTEITDEDCVDVEIIGWLYQFYISERKDQVMARKSAVPAEDIPAVTQLFTPHWIVRYLVENSLGRLWLLNRPESRLREHMAYYIEGEPESNFLKITKPEDIRVCDPAVGSGHMLTYAFDLLALIYEEEGYASNEIPALILRHNLVGIEIDARAAQLAELALVFKAREKFRRFFQPEHLVRPNIVELRDVRFAESELREYTLALDLGTLFTAPFIELLHQFEEAKNFGSLIQPCLDERSIGNIHRVIEAKELSAELFLNKTHLKVLRVLEQAEALTQSYHVVVANPPYMGRAGMSGSLCAFAEAEYPASKADLFAMFIERALMAVATNGYVGMVTMQSWMFLPTFEDLRRHLLRSWRLVSMAHLGARAFDTISGEVVQTTAFVMCRQAPVEAVSVFCRLTAGRNENEKCEILTSQKQRTAIVQTALLDLPKAAMAYWLSPQVRAAYGTGLSVGEITISDGQTKTGENDKYLRNLWEVSTADIGVGKKWVLHPKGGGNRRWFGNTDYVIDWSATARAHYRRDHVARILPEYLWQRRGICWSNVSTSDRLGFRVLTEDEIFNLTSPTVFPRDDRALEFILALLNTPIVSYLLSSVNPTIHFNVKDIQDVPMTEVDTEQQQAASAFARRAIEIATEDWQGIETSFEFRDVLLLRPGVKSETLESSWLASKTAREAAAEELRLLERSNNRLFIRAYGLEAELSADVETDELTLTRIDKGRDMRALLSYIVGCMMGRYSSDHPGVVLANPGDTLREFLDKMGKTLTQLTFVPDKDGIIPVLDGEWFEDDIVARTSQFLRATFGEGTLRENLRFIEDSLGKDLRKYFLTDFYKDHLQTYKKRPIYWMVQSPKKGFSALVYLHRYTRDTLNVVLNRYLREYTVRLRSRQTQLTQSLAGESLPAAERTSARKESERIVKVLHECEEWERESLLPLAQQRIELDLDDGVKVNYLKLADVLAPVPGLAANDE